eukprot:maker-scaffold314_size210232-snap-gene-1.15 protein:Tk09150 transcript:maker-scaffold314_size210232-snap-gene-1.15-mRNA-1 annotation:"af144503_14-coumarate: ligase"
MSATKTRQRMDPCLTPYFTLVRSDLVPPKVTHCFPLERPMVEAYFQGIRARIAREDNKKYFTDGLTGEYISIGDLEPKARKLGKLFASMGVRRGDIVQVSVPNCLELFPLVLGIWLCGAIPSLTDPDLAVTTVRAQIKDTHAKVIICTPNQVQKFQEARDQVQSKAKLALLNVDEDNRHNGEKTPFSVLSQLLLTGCEQLPDPEPVRDFSLDDIAFICWSSGTTGTPKGIQGSYQLVKHRMKPNFKDIPGPEVFTTCMFHISGMCKLLSTAFNAEVIFFQDADLVQDVTLILQACHKYRPGKLSIGSHHGAQLANLKTIPTGLDLTSVQWVLPIGAAVPNKTIEDLKAILPKMLLVNCYGMTELGFLVSYSFDPNSLGIIAEGSQVKIVDPITKVTLGRNLTGEIMHLPGVAEVGVYGQPDPVSQELAVAVVRLAPGATLGEAEIKKHVGELVDDFKQLRGGVRFVDVSLPRNSVGKLVRLAPECGKVKAIPQACIRFIVFEANEKENGKCSIGWVGVAEGIHQSDAEADSHSSAPVCDKMDRVEANGRKKSKGQRDKKKERRSPIT